MGHVRLFEQAGCWTMSGILHFRAKLASIHRRHRRHRWHHYHLIDFIHNPFSILLHSVIQSHFLFRSFWILLNNTQQA